MADGQQPAARADQLGGGAEVEIHPVAWQAFKSDYLRPSKPTLAACYERLKAWAKAEGESVWSVKGFSRGLQEHGITRRKSDTIIYVGLALTSEKSEFEGMEIKDESEPKR